MRSLVRPKPSQGFTLLELIVVLVIISTLLAVAAPRLAGRGQAAVLRGAGHDLQTLATAARARAVLSGRTVGLLLGAEGGELRLVGQRGQRDQLGQDQDGLIDLLAPRRLPDGVNARFEPEGEGDAQLIRFRPDGSADGGELLLSDRRGGELRLFLLAPLGQLRLGQEAS